MAPLLTIRYPSTASAARHIREQYTGGSLLVPLCSPPLPLRQFQPVTLRLLLPDEEAALEAEVLQVIEGLGVVVRPGQGERLLELTRGVDPSPSGEPLQITLTDGDLDSEAESEGDAGAALAMDLDREAESEGESSVAGGARPQHAGLLSWPVEKLQAEWSDLNVSERARVARYGTRPARAFVLRLQDRALHNLLLSNPQISAEEVAIMAGMTNLDPALLKRIASGQEWLRHTAIVRNLVCNPKVTLPQVTRLVDALPDDELRRLTSRGKVRASIKQIIVRKIEQRAGRR